MTHRYSVGEIVTLEEPLFYVYELLTDDGACFYIGKTNDPELRLRSHLNHSRGSNSVREKLLAQKKPRLRIMLGPLPEKEALRFEEESIRSHLRNGVKLENWQGRDPFWERSPIVRKFMKDSHP